MERTKRALESAPAWLLPLGLVAAAFLIRLVYLNQVVAMPTFDHPVMDEQYHVKLAQRIASPAGYGPEPYYRAPLYPYLFAAWYGLAGYSLYWSRFLQIIMGSFLPLLVLLAGRRLFSEKIAFGGALVAVFYPTFLYHDVTILITGLKTFLAILLVWQLYRTQEDRSAANFVLSGLLLGLASLARPNFLVVLPALLVWVWVIIRPKVGWPAAAKRYGLLALATLLVILPVTIRNYSVSKEFIPIAWQGGFNFFLGNNRQADGWSATAPGLDATWEGGYREAIAIAEADRGRRLKKSEISDFWYERGRREILADPAHWLGLVIKKARLFIQGYEIPNNEDPYNVRQFSPLIRGLLYPGGLKFPYGLLAPLALVGIGLSFGQWRRYLLVYLFMAAYVGSFLLFFVCARYRQPLIPFFLLFATAAVMQLVAWVRRAKWRPLSLALAVLLLLGIESNHSLLGLERSRSEAENQVMFGTVYLDQNRLPEAERYFRAAVAADGAYAPARINLAIVCSRTARVAEAEEHYRQALALEPYTADTYFNYATLLLNQNKRVEALAVLERGRAAVPLNDNLHVKLAMTYFELGRIPEARQSAEQALRLNPENSLARQVLQRISAARP